jgi:hypothetical protein
VLVHSLLRAAWTHRACTPSNLTQVIDGPVIKVLVAIKKRRGFGYHSVIHAGKAGDLGG